MSEVSEPDPLHRVHEELLRRMFEPPAEQLEQLRELLSEAGLNKEQIDQWIQEYKTGQIREGQSWGGLHIDDITGLVERMFYQRISKVTLTVEFENPDDDHLTLSVDKISQAWWDKPDEDEEDEGETNPT